MNKKAIIFDMDGVIFDTERVYMNIWIEVYSKHGYTMNKEIYTKLIGRDRNSITKILYNLYGEKFPVTNIFKECDELLKEAIDRGEVPIKEGVLEIFEFLKLKKYKMALATSSSKNKLNMQLKIHNLEEVFDCIVCADDVKVSKPNPEIFLCAARKLNVNPEECIVVEDSPVGIEAAFNANMFPIHVEDLVEANRDIKKYSKKLFKNLIEVRSYLLK